MSDLPVYQSKATPEEREANREIYYKQFSLLHDQHKLEVPILFVSIRCVCNHKIRLKDAYRCLYCGIWFCKSCAEKHFGARVKEETQEQQT